MGTRATIRIKDKHDAFVLYTHWGGAPVTVYSMLDAARKYAWPLPRFEATDFAAAFVASNKPEGGGDIRLVKNHNQFIDTEYKYEVCHEVGSRQLTVTSYVRLTATKFKRLKTCYI